MNKDRESSVVQAFPISRGLITGTVKVMPAQNKVVHIVADGTLSVVFTDGKTLSLDVLGGMDFACGSDVATVSCTAEIWVG